MNLDDLEYFIRIDKEDMLSEIDRLPDQLAAAFGHGLTQDLPGGWKIQRIVISGMGGSAIGADLLSAYVQENCTIPVIVHRDYGLPAYATGNETLVIASSHSGNTEETLDAFETALRNQCRIVVVSTGGELAIRAQKTNIPLWTFMHKGQPRAAVGFSFGLLLAMFARLRFITDPANDLADAVQTMRSFQQHLRPDILAVNNPAKRYAGQLMGRWVTVMGAGLLAPVARRWKGQINEVAKAGANFEFLPEADHNALAGTLHPEEVLNPHMMTLFLRAPSDHPRNRLRSDLTRKTYMLEGLNTDVIDARGKSPLAHIWSLITFGDFMAYYLAMAYGVDPTPVAALENLKKSMLDVD